MEVTAKHSSLNPFASCFIPSSFRIIENTYTEVKNEVKKQEEVKKQKISSRNLEDFFCQNKDTDTVLCSSSESKDLAMEPDAVNVGECTDHEDVTIDSTKDSDVWSTSSILAFLELLVLILYGFSLKDFLVTRDTDNSHKKLDSLKELKCDGECNCPPMFGYVIPPNFFGNPFNLNYSCKKNCIHKSPFTLNSVQKKVPYLKDADLDETFDFEGKSTLEQCSYELKRIVKDLCETISKSTDDCMDQQIDGGKKKNSIELRHAVSSISSEDIVSEAMENTVSPIGTKISSKKSSCSTNDLMEMPKDLQINDDEDHLFLNEANEPTDSDEVFLGVPDTVEKMIEAGLSSKPDLLLDIGESEKCEIPCSIWCDTVPQTARDSYRKFLKWISEKDESNSLTETNSLTRKPLFRESLYKRSFSANDCVKKNSENIAHIQTCFETESRERLILLRRDPLTYFKSDSGYALKNRSNSLSSTLKEDNLHCPINKSKLDLCKNKSSIWGPFDGVDSLWQPLPDCVPTNDNSTKQNNRKARDARRQKSVN